MSKLVEEAVVGTENLQGNFERSMLPHLDAAYNLARWLVRDTATADDVVQEAYRRALQYFHSFDGPSSRAWLMKIVRNAAYAQLGARAGTAVSLQETDSSGENEHEQGLRDPQPDPEARLEQLQTLRAVDAALNTLPAGWRECIILRDVEELSYLEIAQIVEIPVGTVMSRLARARQALRHKVLLSSGDPPLAVTRRPRRESSSRQARALSHSGGR